MQNRKKKSFPKVKSQSAQCSVLPLVARRNITDAITLLSLDSPQEDIFFPSDEFEKYNIQPLTACLRTFVPTGIRHMRAFAQTQTIKATNYSYVTVINAPQS